MKGVLLAALVSVSHGMNERTKEWTNKTRHRFIQSAIEMEKRGEIAFEENDEQVLLKDLREISADIVDYLAQPEHTEYTCRSGKRTIISKVPAGYELLPTEEKLKKFRAAIARVDRSFAGSGRLSIKAQVFELGVEATRKRKIKWEWFSPSENDKELVMKIITSDHKVLEARRDKLQDALDNGKTIEEQDRIKKDKKAAKDKSCGASYGKRSSKLCNSRDTEKELAKRKKKSDDDQELSDVKEQFRVLADKCEKEFQTKIKEFETERDVGTLRARLLRLQNHYKNKSAEAEGRPTYGSTDMKKSLSDAAK